MVKPPELGHVVADYYAGKTHIIICDDYVVKTPEEEQAILDRIMKKALVALQPVLRAEKAAADRAAQQKKQEVSLCTE